MVDASVAKSAGSAAAPKPLPGQCRAVLNAMEEAGHRVVFSQEGSAEWKKHEREFARGWRVRMVARGRAVFIQDARNDEFRDRLSAAAPSAPARRAVEKDAHLIEASCATDRIVISLDRVVRDLFRQICPQVADLREILWADPSREEETVAAWLLRGARLEKKRKLGNR